jgi:hypothetical protein
MGTHDCLSIDKDENENDDVQQIAGTPILYRIPNSSYILKVCPSVSLDGDLSSPLGAHTWYGAALLTAYLSSASPSTNVGYPLATLLVKRNSSLTALELGSGAVGLAGLSFASRLSQNGATNSRVFFSDNVDSLVNRLSENLNRNKLVYTPHVECTALRLDWNQAENWDLPPLDFIFGSELVYTPATAKACLNALLHSTDTCPSALV